MRILIAILPFLFFSLQSYACSCMRQDIEKAYEEYDVVFIGEVKKLGQHRLAGTGFFFPQKIVKAKFAVTKAYKGLEQKKLDIITQNDSAACGFPFEKGIEYAVFANLNEEESKYMVNLCSPTVRIENQEGSTEAERNPVMDFLNNRH